MLFRLLGLERLPVATVSRITASIGEKSVSKLRQVNRQVVLSRFDTENLNRINLDFDGSVLPTDCFEGTAMRLLLKLSPAQTARIDVRQLWAENPMRRP